MRLFAFLLTGEPAILEAVLEWRRHFTLFLRRCRDRFSRFCYWVCKWSLQYSQTGSGSVQTIHCPAAYDIFNALDVPPLHSPNADVSETMAVEYARWALASPDTASVESVETRDLSGEDEASTEYSSIHNDSQEVARNFRPTWLEVDYD